MLSRLSLAAIVTVAGVAVAGCGGGAKAPVTAVAASASAAASAAAPALLLSAEDVRTIGDAAGAAQGPVITGSIQPERRADLRAEIAAVVLQVLRESGDAVRRGELLVRLDDTAIRDSLASAEEAQRAAARALDQAERQLQRMKTLHEQGMTSLQALDDAEVRRNSAQSEGVAAKARVVSARQQLTRTEVRAPFDGVVSERKVSGGDTVQVGKELLKVIDPASMRFEGSVAADHMQDVRLGAAVSFKVNGYPQARFEGRIKRVDASADPATRQVAVLVEFAGGAAPRVAGLYAEGRIEAAGGAVMLPESALWREGERVYVWRIGEGALHKVAVQVGERDARSGSYPLRSGVGSGERILLHPGSALVDGQKVELAAPAAKVSGSAAPSRAN